MYIYFLIHCRMCSSTTLEMCLNNSRSEDSISKKDTNTSKTHSNIDKVIIFAIFVFLSIMTGIIGIALYKRLNNRKGKFHIYWKYRSFFLHATFIVEINRCREKREREWERERESLCMFEWVFAIEIACHFKL